MSTGPEYIDDSTLLEVFASDLYRVEPAGGGVLRLTFVSERAGGGAVTPTMHLLVPVLALDAIQMRLAEAAKLGASPPVGAHQEGATAH